MRKVVSSVFVVATLLSLQVVVVSAQNTDTVRLVTTGSGMSETEAVQVALRSAVEQAYGVFISSDTQILNDELVKDEIVSISSGNVVGYELVSVSQADDGTYHLMVSSEVSLGKLSSFVTARGGSSDFKGGLFGFAIKQQQLNEANELSTIESLVYQLDEIASRSFDYEIQPGQPRQEEDGTWAIPVEITATANANFEVYKDVLVESLRSISLSASERDQYREMNKEVWPVTLGITEDRYVHIILRNKLSWEYIWSQVYSLHQWITNFDVSNGVNQWPLIRADYSGRAAEHFQCDDQNLGLVVGYSDSDGYIGSESIFNFHWEDYDEDEKNVVSDLFRSPGLGWGIPFKDWGKTLARGVTATLPGFQGLHHFIENETLLGVGRYRAKKDFKKIEKEGHAFGFLFSFVRPSPESGPASVRFLADDIVTLETLSNISGYTVKRRHRDANQRLLPGFYCRLKR